MTGSTGERVERGNGSGALSIALGGLSLFAVLCFHFPALLTTPELRAVYRLDWVRATLFVAILASLFLGLISCLRMQRVGFGLVGISLAGASTLLGGAWIEADAPVAPSHYIGLDWFVLDLLILALLFIPLERMRPLDAALTVMRKGFRTDLLHFFASHLLVGISVFLTMAPAAWAFAGIVDPAFQTRVAGQPVILQILEAMILADLFQYGIHRAFHEIPFLWRFHSIHHSSRGMDWLAGSRLHLVDIVVTRAIAFLPLFVMGFSERALQAYLVLIAFHAVFNHANIDCVLRPLRWIITTPRYHHWHHTADAHAIDRNFAAQIPAIDWVFGTAYQTDGWPERYGLAEGEAPDGWWNQVAAPFRRRSD
jgi:sterol desaturase/sphingolipid hydroxylase (fatty acid hydroxylase superfamily)